LLVGFLAVWVGVGVIDRLFPPPLPGEGSLAFVMLDREGRPVSALAAPGGVWRLQAELERIDPDFLAALLAVEDKRFHAHGGVDWLAMARAAGTAVTRGRVVSGGSTLTMQTARLIEPRPKRTVGAKLAEMWRAHQLEWRLSKDEILALYLTLTPYGGNLEGVRAASWAYFGREPDRLSEDQIALLIALPQSPEMRRPDRRAKGAKAGRDAVAGRLAELGLFTAEQAAFVASAPLPSRQAFPDRAWHAARRVAQEAGEPVAVATLDLGLQEALEDLLARQVTALEPEVQMAAMVVHIPSRGVRAMAGSAGRERPGGWLDLTQSARSPGSTLKPFIFALAFDDGFATPLTRIADLPKRFDTYRPENFDGSFRGDVRMSEALAHSLNVPAVLALDRIGPARFAAQLRFAGVEPRIAGMATREAGLALALGGAGMTLEELAMLYAGLGDRGRVKPLAWTLAQEAMGMTRPGARFMGETSAQQVLDILRSAPAPAGRVPGSLTAEAPDIAFKTGTSYGFRDAWAAGVAGDHALVVWVGRPDGAPRPGVTGREAALPVLFALADLVDSRIGLRDDTRRRLTTTDLPEARGPLERFGTRDAPPDILFPPDGAEVYAGADRPGRRKSFVLAASGGQDGALSWYVDGEPAPRDAAGAAVWTPPRDGFYRISVVDTDGRTASARVRVTGVRPEG
jgi:penicillin-binding protein 1C